MPDRPAADGHLVRGADELARGVITAVCADGAGLVVVADSSAVVIRACRAALDRLPPDRQRVWSPRTAQELLAGLRSVPTRTVGPGARTVIWLDDLDRYLTPDDPELAEQVAAALRGALHLPGAMQAVIVGTLPVHPLRRQHRLQAPASGGRDRWTQTRALLGEATVLAAGLPVEDVAGEQPAPVVSTVVVVQPAVAPSVVLAPSVVVTPSVVPVPPARPAAERAQPVVPVRPAAERAQPVVPVRPAAERAQPVVPVRPAAARARTSSGAPAAEPVAASGDRTDIAAQDPVRVRIHGSVLLEVLDQVTGAATEEPASAQPLPVPVAEPEPLPEREPTPDPEPMPDRDRVPEPEPLTRAAPESTSKATAEPVPAPVIAGPRWVPAPLPPIDLVPEAPTDVCERARIRELNGNLLGAERLYERAAIGGDLDALSRLARLRSRLGADQLAEQLALYRRARDARNTGVLFSLAAAGHADALRLLRQLQEEAAPKAKVPEMRELREVREVRDTHSRIKQPVAAKGSRRRKRRRSR